MLAALWAYDGWNNMPMAAGEVQNPRNIRAPIVGMIAVMAIYCLANLSYFYACRSRRS
jgi:APA family basic amino acid/polyamine antiporter